MSRLNVNCELGPVYIRHYHQIIINFIADSPPSTWGVDWGYAVGVRVLKRPTIPHR